MSILLFTFVDIRHIIQIVSCLLFSFLGGGILSFVDSIERLCNEKNISISKMLSDLGLAKGLVSNWKKRGTIPNGDILLKIAEYFDVSVDYLLGLSTKKHRSITLDDVDNLVPSYKNETFELTGIEYIIANTEQDMEKLKEVMDSLGVEYTVSRVPKTPTKEQKDEFSAVFNSLTHAEQEKVKEYIDFVISQRDKG